MPLLALRFFFHIYVHNGADKYVKYAVMYIFYAHRMVQKSINYGFMHDLESSA